MLLHINPTRQQGKRTGSLARASGWYMTFFAAGVISEVLITFLLGGGFRPILVTLGVGHQGEWNPVLRGYPDLDSRVAAGFSKPFEVSGSVLSPSQTRRMIGLGSRNGCRRAGLRSRSRRRVCMLAHSLTASDNPPAKLNPPRNGMAPYRPCR